MKKFKLFHNEQYLGDIIFNKWNYQFILNQYVTLEEWNNNYWILPLFENQRQLTWNDLFEQLNIRLPLRLRRSEDTKKLDFIQENHLKVISDNYELRPA